MNQLKLAGKTAIITGGAKGIGRATAEKFLAEGAAVAIWDVDAAAGAATVKALSVSGRTVLFDLVNTADFDATAAAAGRAFQQLGHIDILVNNAGITRDASLKKMSIDHWQQVMDVNLTGVFNCTKVVYPYMEAQGYGRILNAASVVAHYGNFGQTNYVASKAGVIGMTKVWAREFGRKGITVNAVAPGFIQTDMTAGLPDAVMAEMIGHIPLGRLGSPVDVANAYAFLASDEAAFINGAVLNVDGGMVF